MSVALLGLAAGAAGLVSRALVTSSAARSPVGRTAGGGLSPESNSGVLQSRLLVATGDSRGGNVSVLAGIAAAGIVALGGAAWYARRRR